MISDEQTSRVMLLVDPYRESRHQIHHVWIVNDRETGKDVAMAMVSDPAEESQGLPVFNSFVADEYRRQGLGTALVEVVSRVFDPKQLAAYYTLDSVRIYQSYGFDLAEFNLGLPGVRQALLRGDRKEACRLHVDGQLNYWSPTPMSRGVGEGDGLGSKRGALEETDPERDIPFPRLLRPPR